MDSITQQGNHVYSACVNTDGVCVVFCCVHCVHMHHEFQIENNICFLVYILCYVNIGQRHWLPNTDIVSVDSVNTGITLSSGQLI